MFDRLLSALVPPVCLACRAPLPRAGETLCAACRLALPWLGERVCPRCALPAPCGAVGGVCPAWRADFACAWAPFAHDGPARDIVAALKFRGATAAADVMAAHVAANAPPRLLGDATLVPVPAHPSRVRARGFDQGALVTAAVARRTGRPVAACLRRDGPRVRQVGAGRAARRRAGERIEVLAAGAVPAVAVLVDDVHTTGATLDACARALRRAGSDRVAAVTYTRTLP